MNTAHLLLCLLALCSLWHRPAQAAVYSPPAPLSVNAFFGGNESWFSFPEASPGSNYSMDSVTSRPRFAIALSGGGMRAATVGLGMLRGLHQVCSRLLFGVQCLNYDTLAVPAAVAGIALSATPTVCAHFLSASSGDRQTSVLFLTRNGARGAVGSDGWGALHVIQLRWKLVECSLLLQPKGDHGQRTLQLLPAWLLQL